jgi:hypothetical protein
VAHPVKLTSADHPEAVRRYGHVKPAGSRKTRCNAVFPGRSFLCTRPRGHSGPHVAHGRFRRVRAVWDSGSSGAEVRKPARRRARGPGKRALRTPGRERGVIARLLTGLTAHAEEVALVVFFLAFVWFAFGWLRLVFGG